ncbi:amidase family protein [Frankia sp. Cpl3]|uniref:amidase family protein n=1 Tax=Parafrankia colletiae TaxID=573497 RepID=UPI001F516F01|nr:amidase family protein [Parafrankia colletiae]MCK9901402.1 amidase family protein [Frankia sp. Cpl3]
MISGGSSSGSGVAVAEGLVTFAVGTDTAGSGRADEHGRAQTLPELVSTRGSCPPAARWTAQVSSLSPSPMHTLCCR